MSEQTLESLVHILAILATTRQNTAYVVEKNITISFLSKQFKTNVVEKYITCFEKYYHIYRNDKGNESFEYSNYQATVTNIINQIKPNLPVKQRIFIIINLLEFTSYLKSIFVTEKEVHGYYKKVETIALLLNIAKPQFDDYRFYCCNQYHLIKNPIDLLIISGKQIVGSGNIKTHILEGFKGIAYLLNTEKDIYLIRYKGRCSYYIDQQIVINDNTYFFSATSVLLGEGIKALYYNDINKLFLDSKSPQAIIFKAENISYNFSSENVGIHPLSFECYQNEMVGILGSSGSGKTTLMKLVSGKLKPVSGRITINGCNLQQIQNESNIIAYVPQDDLLINELTVYHNLLLSTKLSIGNLDKKRLHEYTNDYLELLGLFEIKDLKVGTINRNIISGGQRKRLNIALELIREPSIIFLDEPTSGLSSSDALRIIKHLKAYSLKGNLLFINIHQPSDEIIYLFDKIIILDQGGYSVFFGRPGEALPYFRKVSKTLEIKSEEYFHTESEEILQILEETEIDSIGTQTNKRITKASEWYQLFRNQKQTNFKKTILQSLPESVYKLPGFFYQLITYLERTFRSKLSDSQFIVMALSITPILALILAILTKNKTIDIRGNEFYSYYYNENIPSFLFMSVIVAMFVGLIVCAQEIFKEKKLLQREQFLKNSKLAYYSSKVLFYVCLSLLQTTLYVLTCVPILKLPGNKFYFWLFLSLTSVTGNVIGLLLSANLKSVMAIYIAIPLILIPQILLSGVVVKYDKIHPFFGSERYVPVIGDLMPTRWTYEGIIVNQFKNNNFQSHLFNLEKSESKLSFLLNVKLPLLENKIENLVYHISDHKTDPNSELVLLNHELIDILRIYNDPGINPEIKEFNKDTLERYSNFFASVKKQISSDILILQLKKDSVFESIENTNSKQSLQELKKLNTNRTLYSLISRRQELREYIISGNRIIQLVDPVYQEPVHKLGRTHFYAASKKIGNSQISTIAYNILICLIYIISLFVILIFELPKKIVNLLL